MISKSVGSFNTFINILGRLEKHWDKLPEKEKDTIKLMLNEIKSVAFKKILEKMRYKKKQFNEYSLEIINMKQNIELSYEEKLSLLNKIAEKSKEKKQKKIIDYCRILIYDILENLNIRGVEAHRKVVEIDSDYVEAWNNLGAACSFMGEYEEAIEAFKKSIEIIPENKEVWNNLGLVYNNIEDHHQAIKAFSRTLEIDPDYTDGWFNIAKAFEKIGNFKEARRAYAKSIESKTYDK